MKVCDVCKGSDNLQEVRLAQIGEHDDVLNVGQPIDACDPCRTAVVDKGLVVGLVERFTEANPRTRQPRAAKSGG